MATFTLNDSLSNYIEKLEEFDKSTTAIEKAAVYEGAGVVADKIREAIWALPDHRANDAIRQGLADGLGISKIKADGRGGVYARIGIEGYNSEGVANPLMAHAINSGTPNQAPYPWIDKTFRSAENEAVKAMENKLNEVIEKEFGGN